MFWVKHLFNCNETVIPRIKINAINISSQHIGFRGMHERVTQFLLYENTLLICLASAVG
ncbi:hypothetical protein ALT721_2220008 [Alteromonas alvinellae]